MNQIEAMKQALVALSGVLEAHRIDEKIPENRSQIIWLSGLLG